MTRGMVYVKNNLRAPASFPLPITPVNSYSTMQSVKKSISITIDIIRISQLWKRTSTLSKTTSSPHLRVRLSQLPRSSMEYLTHRHSMVQMMTFTMSISMHHQYRTARPGSGHTSSITFQPWVVSLLLSSELLASSWGDTKALSNTSP